jgi:aspartate aminotransferase
MGETQEALVSISRMVRDNLERASWIRRMFEEGLRMKAEFGAEAVFDFSLGNPDIEPPAAFGPALARLASDPRPGSHAYMPNAGYPAVRAAVARRASADQGLELQGSHIVMSVGAAGALNVILKTILDPGDEVVVIKPWFAEYYFYIQNHGGSFVAVPSGPGFSLDAEAVRRALTPRTAAVIVNSPNNPTGTVYSKAELEALAQVLAEHGRATGRAPYLIADEPYREIVYGGLQVPSCMLAYPETIVATSWSKSLSLPGERVGYIAVSPRCSEAKALVDGMAFATRVLGFVNAPALMQRVVAEILDERCEVASYESRCKLLAEGLRGAGYDFIEPRGAFYLFPKVPPRRHAAVTVPAGQDDDVAFAMHLKAERILGVPGVGFGAPGWFRLSCCVAEETIARSIPGFRRALESW